MNLPTPILPRDHISHTQLSMYLRCSMQYYFRYVLDLKERPKLAPAAGSAGHSAVETNTRRKIATGVDMPLPDVLDVFDTAYTRETADITPDDLGDDDIGRTKDNIIQSLTIYMHREAPTILPALVETEFDLRLPEPIRIVNGRIDLVDTDFGIWDNKFTTSRTPKSQLEVDISPQLTLYDLAFTTIYEKQPANLGFIQFLPPGKDPIRYPADIKRIVRSPEAHTPNARKARHDRLIHQYLTVEKAINDNIFIPTDDPIKCSWCGYRDTCQSSLVKDDYTALRIRHTTQEPT